MARPKGSKTLYSVANLSSKFDAKEFIDYVRKNYKKNDRLAVWYGDHLFGKAIQPIEGEFRGNVTLTFDKSFEK